MSLVFYTVSVFPLLYIEDALLSNLRTALELRMDTIISGFECKFAVYKFQMCCRTYKKELWLEVIFFLLQVLNCEGCE